MTTLSELRSAAELLVVLYEDEKNGLTAIETRDRLYPEMPLDVLETRVMDGIVEMARHILVTVREDDVEPVTVERVRAMGFVPRLTDLGNEYFGAGTPLMVAWHPRRNQWFLNGASTEWKPKTCGQLRALLSALGIEVRG